MNYVYAVLVIIAVLLILKFILKLSIKIFSTFLIIIAIVITALVVFTQPKMHKEFNFNVIEKFIKFDDGGVSIKETIKTTTTTNKEQTK